MTTAKEKFQAHLQNMSIPVVGSPMFIVSYPELVMAQCKAGVIGSFPALNARQEGEFEQWLIKMNEELDRFKQENPDKPVAPYAVNQIVHRSNIRLQYDLDLCVKYEVPIVITSLGARAEVNEAVHSYGGIVMHDIINNKFAKKAIEKGADGLIAVAAGAGGHAGTLSPFALVQEIREWFDGPLWLSGCISNGANVLAAQAMGADAAYLGSAFIATKEAHATENYKQAIVDYNMDDIVYTNYFSGVHGNYLKPSIAASGMDPDDLPEADPTKMDFASATDEKSTAKAWKDIWGCGQGIGDIKEIQSTEDYVNELIAEYNTAKARIM